MANLRAIRNRIKSVENTRQITKSMKMVAAAKLRRTQSAVGALRRFADELERMLPEAVRGAKQPLLQPHGGEGRCCFVLILGNRGLCGTYNTALLRYAQERLRPDGLLVCCGRWGRDQLGAVERSFEISDAPSAGEARALADYLRELYLSGRAERVVLLYQSFASVLRQEPTEKTLLPISPPAEETDAFAPIFEPDREAVLEELLTLYLETAVHAVLLEARTGEHSARMTAMTAAADNTEALISELTLELNHARQDAITTEITEIVGGAAAL